MVSIKRISAIAAITFGILFTFTTLFSIWDVSPFVGYLGNNHETINKFIPTLGLLTVAFIALLIILRAAEEKK